MICGWVLLHAQLAILQGHVAGVLHGASRSLPAATWHVKETAEGVLRFVLASTLGALALLLVFSSASPLVLVLVGVIGQLREVVGAATSTISLEGWRRWRLLGIAFLKQPFFGAPSRSTYDERS